MFLYLNEYGYRLSKNRDTLEIEHSDGSKENYSLNGLSAVYLGGEARISKAIIIELTKRNIDTVLLSKSGKPMVYVYPSWIKPKALRMLEKQMKFDRNTEKTMIEKFVTRAIKSKYHILGGLYRSRKRSNKENAMKIMRYRDRIREIYKKSNLVKCKNLEEFRNKLRGFEGISAKLYFESLKYVIPDEFNYKGLRTRRPPEDLFNSAISYGYAHLKYFIEKAFLLKGINPYYGYLHRQENDKNKQYLVFDMMEGYRHTFVDKTVINLIIRRRLSHENAFSKNSGMFLNKRGRETVSSAIYKSYFGKFRKSFRKC